MEDIIKAVVAQTGLSNEIARQAVLVVLSQIKSQLPKAVADQVDLLLGGLLKGEAAGQGGAGASGSGATNDVVGSVLKGLGGMLGGGK